MNHWDHYKVLSEQFEHINDGERIPVSVKELKEILFCTRRNVILILKKLSSLKWIEWQPGIGRSKQSYLIMHKDMQELLLERIQWLLEQGKIKEALTILEELDLTSEWRNKVLGWLQEKQGYRQELNNGRKQDVLQFPYFRRMTSFDPIKAIRQTELHMIEQIYDGLLKRDCDSGEAVPHIAHHWQVNQGMTEWTFYLRKHVLFHNGQELTSDDVRFTLERLKKADNWMYRGLRSVNCIDEYTIVLTFHTPCPLLPRYLAYPSSVILPATTEDLVRHPIGTGPYRLVRNSEDLVELRAFDSYFNGRPLLDIIRMWILPTYYAGEMQQRADIQFFPFLLDENREVSEWNEISKVDLERKVLVCNSKKEGVLRDSPVRKAIAQFIDSEKLIQELGQNRYQPCTTLYAKSRHKVELSRSSTVEGETTLTLYTNEESLNVRDAEWLAEYLRLDVHVEVVTVPIHQLIQEHVREKADLFLFSMVNTSDRELSFLHFLLGNGGVVVNLLEEELSTKINHMVEKATTQRGPRDVLEQIEKMLSETYSVIPLYKTVQHAYIHPMAQGANLDDFGFLQYRKLWFKSPSKSYKIDPNR